MAKQGTHKFVIAYSAFYGDPYQPIHFSDDEQELKDWLSKHRAQYPTGDVKIMPGDDFPHEKARPEEIEAP